MKVKVISDEQIVVFLNKNYACEVKFDDYKKLESYFKTLFIKLNDNYKIRISGYYNIDVYRDSNYGLILDMTHENIDYYNYFDNQVDMKINLMKITSFLYEIDYCDLEPRILKNTTIYKKGGKIYLKANEDIDDFVLGLILEKSEIIYGDFCNNVLINSQEVII